MNPKRFILDNRDAGIRVNMGNSEGSVPLRGEKMNAGERRSPARGEKRYVVNQALMSCLMGKAFSGAFSVTILGLDASSS